jgi:exodeoxyribonuclease (lambda-induced)
LKIHRQLQQKSWEWFKARAGKVTGSELKNLITEGLSIRGWKTQIPKSYLHRKLAEKWRGEALQSFQGNQQTDQGVLWEDRARKHFASFLEADIETVGGIESDDQRCWCSPDGIIGETIGLEIKCPNADTHVGWLLSGEMPEEHALQVHFSLWVSGFSEWKFLSYCNGYPQLAVSAGRSMLMCALIEDAVHQFNEKMDNGFAKLVELNGGPPPPRVAPPITAESQADPRANMFSGFEDRPEKYTMKETEL